MALDRNLKKLGIILQGMEQDHLSREDFTRAFESLVKAVDKLKKEFAQVTINAKKEMTEDVAKAKAEFADISERVGKLAQDMKNASQSDSRTTMRMFEQKMREFEALIPEDFDDSELRRLIQEVRNEIPEIPEQKEFDPQDILDTLDEHDKEIEELKKAPRGRGGGQLTDKALQYAMGRMVKTETPTGTIDGANTYFTVTGTIHAVLGFELGSRVISLGTYSITGGKRQTIEFDDPIPANYSDDSFVIIYI